MEKVDDDLPRTSVTKGVFTAALGCTARIIVGSRVADRLMGVAG